MTNIVIVGLFPLSHVKIETLVSRSTERDGCIRRFAMFFQRFESFCRSAQQEDTKIVTMVAFCRTRQLILYFVSNTLIICVDDILFQYNILHKI